MPHNAPQIAQQLAALDGDISRLLKESFGAEFWIEVMERAEAAKEQLALVQHAQLIAGLDALLLRRGLTPPSLWAHVLADSSDAAARR